MRWCVLGTWLCCCGLILVVWRCYGSDNIYMPLHQREQRTAWLTFEWQADVEETPTNGLPELPTKLQGRRRYVHTLTVARQGDWTYIVQTKPLRGLPNDVMIERRSVLNKEFAYTFSIRQEAVASVLDYRSVAQVWRTDGEAVRKVVSPLLTGAVLPEVLVLLAGFSPADLYGKNAQVQVTSRQSDVILEVKDLRNGRLAQMTLSKSHALCPVSMRVKDADTTRQFAVHSTRWVKGVWIPSEIVEEYSQPFLHMKRIWTLRSIKPTRITKSDWDVPVGTVVSDFRLTTVENGQDPDRSVVVSYSWQGKFPSEARLRDILEQQRAESRLAQETSKVYPWYRFAPPSLLILIGALWYWRLKRAERKASSP